MDERSIKRKLTHTIVMLACLLLSVHTARASQATDQLQMFKRYFGPGLQIASYGAGMRGAGKPDPDLGGKSLAKATLAVPLPPNANVIAAFLYWENLEKTAKPSSPVA